MNEAVEGAYFNWLCSNVIDVRPKDPSQTYWNLLRILHGTEFVWTVSLDENRAEDGKELRREFILLANVEDDLEWRHNIGCSVLEMMIAFARNAKYMTDIPVEEWFWEMIRNLGLDGCSDAVELEPQDIVETLERFMYRKYEPDGSGGLFPMFGTDHDQREVEIWYQFCEYVSLYERYV